MLTHILNAKGLKYKRDSGGNMPGEIPLGVRDSCHIIRSTGDRATDLHGYGRNCCIINKYNGISPKDDLVLFRHPGTGLEDKSFLNVNLTEVRLYARACVRQVILL